jgi:hypothetical protein
MRSFIFALSLGGALADDCTSQQWCSPSAWSNSCTDCATTAGSLMTADKYGYQAYQYGPNSEYIPKADYCSQADSVAHGTGLCTQHSDSCETPSQCTVCQYPAMLYKLENDDFQCYTAAVYGAYEAAIAASGTTNTNMVQPGAKGSSDSKVSPGAIAGISAGAVATIAAAFLVHKKRSAQRQDGTMASADPANAI